MKKIEFDQGRFVTSLEGAVPFLSSSGFFWSTLSISILVVISFSYLAVTSGDDGLFVICLAGLFINPYVLRFLVFQKLKSNLSGTDSISIEINGHFLKRRST